jgi:hypothetical protein
MSSHIPESPYSSMPGRPYSAAGPHSIVTLILGFWVLVAPFILGFSDQRGAVWNNVISGIIIMVVAGVRIWGGVSSKVSWINAFMGIWLIISPWAAIFDSGSGFAWNQVIVGIIVAIASALSATASQSYPEPPAAGF